MPINPRKKLEDKARDLAMLIDYALYSICNPFKFKQFPKGVARILVVELLKIGDVLVATPTIRALKERYKNAQVDALILPETKELLKNNQNLNNIITYTTYKKVKEEIKKRNYDLAILLHPGSLKISWLLFSTGVKYRIGCTKSGLRYGKGFFLNKKIKPNNIWQHKIKDNLDVVKAIGIDTLNKNIEMPIELKAKKMIKQLGKKWSKKVIGIHASSQHRSQRWIPERFAEVADILAKKRKCNIIFTGTKEEIPYINKIISMTKQKEKMVNLAGKTNMQEYVALIERLNLLISVDTGAIHLASAVKTPTLTLFGPTIPTFWGPSYKKSKVIWKEKTACVGCRKYYCIYNKGYECMRSITVPEVVKEAGLLLKK